MFPVFSHYNKEVSANITDRAFKLPVLAKVSVRLHLTEPKWLSDFIVRQYQTAFVFI